jgi:peptidoglycan hydrolase CwlO-like protein
MRKLLVTSLVIFVFFIYVSAVLATECQTDCGSVDECSEKIKQCQSIWNDVQKAKEPHETTLKKMDADIAAFQQKIVAIGEELKIKEKAINKNEGELASQQDLLSHRVRASYIRSFKADPLVLLFTQSADFTNNVRLAVYQQKLADDDKQSIVDSVGFIKDLEDRKVELTKQKTGLAALAANLNTQADATRKLISEASAYQTTLSSKIGALSSRQQSLLAERSGTFTTSVGDVPLADDPNAAANYNPGFSPAFGGFSFGAYTHRKGMSQYGAKGRANSGQNFKDILKAYYSRDVTNKDTGGSISVEGYGNLQFEGQYLYGIAEMPADFPSEALKAQAIAARSYAYTYKSQGKSICTSQSCQVYNNGKGANPPGAWKQAVDDTRGQVIEGVTAFYSSTTGGYSTTSGWDTKCGSQGCWTGDAYEKIAGSPWFYKGWYTQDYYNNSGKCGRGHPWLTQEEFADILNAWLVRKNGSDSDRERILPTTINSCSVGGGGGNPFSISEMRDKASGMGGAFTSISNLTVSYSTDGFTANVHLETNKGGTDIPGGEFKETFNLRAPGYISLRSPLYNIERK